MGLCGVRGGQVVAQLEEDDVAAGAGEELLAGGLVVEHVPIRWTKGHI